MKGGCADPETTKRGVVLFHVPVYCCCPGGLVSPAREQTLSYPSPLLLGLTLGYLQLLPARVHSS